MIPKFWYWLRVAVTPGCWIQVHSYSKAWDTVLNSLMDSGIEFVFKNTHTATIGPFTVWTENHPYGSFNPYGAQWPEVRPKRATILKAWDHYSKVMLKCDEIEQLATLEKLGKL